MTVDLSHLVSLQNLEPFALQSSDKEPHYFPGKFFVCPQEINEQDPLVTADNGIIATTTWFKTPVSFMFQPYKENPLSMASLLTRLIYRVLIGT